MTDEAGGLTLEQAMERLGLSRAEIYRRIVEGELKADKVEHQLRFQAEEVERYATVLRQERESLTEELDRWLAFFAGRASERDSADSGGGLGPVGEAPRQAEGMAEAPGGGPVPAPPSEAERVQALGELVLGDAARSETSDLYLDPVGDGARLLFAMETSVTEVARFSAALCGRLRDWLKGLGPVPAEGAAPEALVRREMDGSPRQYRLAVIPTALGELVHLHDFAACADGSLEDLGYAEGQARSLRASVGGQPGLLAVAGPPDHWGERHRLALARELSADGRLVVSVEHRIHYRSESLVQLETGSDAELFPALWRRALDMRPDCIFLDEVRNQVEAGCLLEGVQAGAVVVCQVSAPDACSALRRLVNLEVDVRALAWALLACSERLVLRRLCPTCRIPLPPGSAGHQGGFALGPGCSECVGGWLGSRMLFGLVPADEALAGWLVSGALPPGPETRCDELSLTGSLRAAVAAGEVDGAALTSRLRGHLTGTGDPAAD